MSKILPLEGFLMNLKQEIPPTRRRLYLTREKAYEMLKKFTGEDFGYDIDAWEKWIMDHEKKL